METLLLRLGAGSSVDPLPGIHVVRRLLIRVRGSSSWDKVSSSAIASSEYSPVWIILRRLKVVVVAMVVVLPCACNDALLLATVAPWCRYGGEPYKYCRLAKRLLLLLYIGFWDAPTEQPNRVQSQTSYCLARLFPGANRVRGETFMRLLVEYQRELRPPWPPAHIDNLRGESKQFSSGDESWWQMNGCG